MLHETLGGSTRRPEEPEPRRFQRCRFGPNTAAVPSFEMGPPVQRGFQLWRRGPCGCGECNKLIFVFLLPGVPASPPLLEGPLQKSSVFGSKSSVLHLHTQSLTCCNRSGAHNPDSDFVSATAINAPLPNIQNLPKRLFNHSCSSNYRCVFCTPKHSRQFSCKACAQRARKARRWDCSNLVLCDLR
jgi:hypothetical protein